LLPNHDTYHYERKEFLDALDYLSPYILSSVDNKKLCSNLSEGAMRPSIVGDLIAHAWFENEHPTVLELSVQLTLETQKNVSFHAPVVCQVTRRILDHPDSDIAEVLGAPTGDACLTFMLSSLYARPVGYPKWNVSHLHVDFSECLSPGLCGG